MTTKLTLSVDSKIIERAKQYSKKTGKSLSKVVEDYFRELTMNQRNPKRSILELKGIAGPVSEDFDYKKEITKYLREKYK